MARIAMILRRSPYGDVAAAEAVRHALGAASQEMGVDLILLGGGVQLARTGQDDTGTGFTNLGSSLEECVEMGVAVHAEAASLAALGVGKADLLKGVARVGPREIAGLLKQARWTMIFRGSGHAGDDQERTGHGRGSHGPGPGAGERGRSGPPAERRSLRPAGSGSANGARRCTCSRTTRSSAGSRTRSWTPEREPSATTA